jgi:competence protein ComEC
MRLRERLEDAPWAGLAEALLLGVKDNLDTEVAVAFRSAGCSHILALSGMHLALLTTVLTFLLTRVLGLKAAAVGGGLGIIAYVYMAGNFPSLTRAAIMYLLGSLCALGPFPKSGVRVRQRAVLGMAFIIQLIGSPQAGQSLSFILSYLALGGLLFIAPAIHDLFRGRLPEILAQPLAASIGAFIATAPVSAWVFGVLRPVGILAGLLIVPLVTAFMLIALAAWILPGTALGLILTILYDILTGIAAGSARIPGISGAAPWVVMTLSLGSAGVLMAVSHRQTLRRSILVPFD